MPHRTSSNVTVLNAKWSKDQVLAEARRRTKEQFNSKKTQEMLSQLLAEAGWTEEDFIDALCQDIIHRGCH